MSTRPATVFVVDDDPDVRRALARLLRAAGCGVSAFGSAAEFLSAYDPEAPGCLILDVVMPGIDGLELQAALRAAVCPLPIVFLSGSADIPMSVQAMKAGAVTFLTKPVEDSMLIAAVAEALKVDEVTRRAQSFDRPLQKRLSTLTPREREVLAHVVAGQLNKQIAADLGTAEKTVKVHRSRVMRKMGARSVAELVQLANRVGIAVTPEIRL
jgi:FixJ family two-component response regulator